MAHPKAWTKHEAALLAEVYIKVTQEGCELASELSNLSLTLRTMAENEGETIDDTYRNLNGMHWQYGLMKAAFERKEFDSRGPTTLFIQVASLCKNNPVEFRTILWEAHKMAEKKEETMESTKDIQSLFIKWLNALQLRKIIPEKCVECISAVSIYAVSHSVSRIDFWEIRDFRKFNQIRVSLSANRIFKLSHPNLYRLFEKVGKLYSDFIRDSFGATPIETKPVEKKVTADNPPVVQEEPERTVIQVQDETTEISAEVTTESNQQEDYSFGTWLTQRKHLAENTRRMYVSSMRYVNDFALRKGYTVQSIFEVESEQLQDIAKEVLEDEEFIAYNIEKHNRFSAALQAYLLFRLGGGVVTDTKTKTRKRNLSAFEKDSRLMDFINWLVSEKGLAENTSRSYASNVKSAEVYALEKDIIHSGLFDASDDEIKDLVSLILNDAEFSEYNTQQHNRFSAALQAYLLYRIGERAGVSDIKPRKRSGRIEDTISCSDDLRGLIEERFAFGIRPESAIDILKLRNYASMADISLVEDDELLAKQIAAGGILCDGKVYFFPNEVSQELKDKIQTIFDEDYSVLYYEEFFDRNYDWLDERHITSWEILRELIQSEIDDVFASKNFFSSGNNRINELDAVEQEIAAFWGDTPIHTYDEVYELLPYIPNDKLKFYLSCSEKFVWSSAETFAYVDRLIITEEEKEAIIEFVTEKCANAGYATISDIPLGNIEEENYQMSLNAIYDAIYFSVLKSRFSINGKILTNNSESIDILSLAKAYCVDKDTLSFAAFHKYVTKLNGTSNRQVAYKAAYDTMIRVTEDQFVADRFVDFNVDEIDELLDQYIVGGFASIKSIASFALFPSCHYPWNHYVLESFCYKYSKKYSLQVINFNEKNAGIIAKQDLPLSYMDMAATAAARSGLELTEDIIGRYLCDNGFFAKSKMSALKDIINKAKELREAL